MVNGFTRSKEGEEAYSKVGLQYDNHLQDTLYQNWIAETTADGLSNYTNYKEKELVSLQVVQTNNPDYTGDEGEGGASMYKYFLVYNWIQRRLDPACNITHRTVADVGKYPIPIAHYKIVNMDFGKQKRVPDGITSILTGYSIPWTRENIVNILKEVSLPTDSKLQCSIKTVQGDMSFTVESLQDLMNGTPFEELMHFGRTPTDRERKQWIENQGGTDSDIRRIVEYQRKAADSHLQQRPVTVDDVQSMIQRQIQTIQPQPEQPEQQQEEEPKDNSKKSKRAK